MKKLPTDDDQFLSELERLGVPGMSEKYSVHPDAIYMKLGRMGVSAKDLNHPRFWGGPTDIPTERIIELLDEGYSQSEIARMTGLSRQAINQRIKYHGL